MEDVVIKPPLNRILYKMLGKIDLVDQWWHSPNKAFDMKTPDQVYQSGSEGRNQVRDYLDKFSDYNI